MDTTNIMKQSTNRSKALCLCLLLTFLFLPSNFGNICTGSQPHTNPSLVTQLDLSQCNISSLQESDFKLHPNLQTLDLSHNLLKQLDFSVFRFNTFLKHLDISYNNLRNINCSSLQFIKDIKHLIMAYNNFDASYLCQEFGYLTKLEHLGLSSKRIQKNDFENIALQEFKSIFLALEELQGYYPGSLRLLKMEKLHVILPQRVFFLIEYFLLDVFTSTTTLEISQFICKDCSLEVMSLIAKQANVSTLILSNIIMPWRYLNILLEGLWKSSVKHLFINGITIIEDFDYISIDVSEGSIESLYIENVMALVFEFYKHPLLIFSEMIVHNLTLSNAELTFFFCPQFPSIFQSLNFANNGLTDGVFQQCRSLPVLRYLNLHNNRLEKLLSLSSMTSTMNSLQHLDVSFNTLYYDRTVQCEWSESLVFLNLSRNKLTESVFECLPNSVEILDLSRNQIKSISKEIKLLAALKEINLALNQLSNIPDCRHMSKTLRVLNIDNNGIFSPSGELFQSCRNVKSISALNNNFVCNCEMRSFVSSMQAFKGEIVGWPTSYNCELPEEFNGIILKDFHLSEVSCNLYLLIAVVVGSVLVVVLLLVFTCKYFDLPWYLRMIFQWLRSKYRVKQVNVTEIQNSKLFHGFISYSQKDGDWVRNILRPNLEKDDGSVRICLHERDFIPGQTIVENIICCIEKSFKSIFVLSPNFLQSEWCHYELFFAQHSLFGKNSDNLILILLEPIPQYLIPNKYSKLKALMKQRTYMEWPKEKAKQGLFWANLRGAMEIDLPVQEGKSL
ncbi:PREDICTED: toll-like receptor 6 [Nanorana parkeri]|uniref:toll-like receptor 6 n=1 Tax=Nanorana parkeri TaxID=125878 RepID=UPI0008542B5C|nr:PREDICTED: toll-like receptor 6 [Nanorana parkeri]